MTTTLDFNKLNNQNDNLLPVIIQHHQTKDILMLGYMNPEAFEKTKQTNLVTFYSRSKQRLWTKGEQSGNTLQVKSIHSDCDNDTLLILAEPQGPTCHTGTYSCFGEQTTDITFLNTLHQTIQDRKQNPQPDSYTSQLFEKGTDAIVQKVGEEGVETVIAGKNPDKEELIYEASDLLYHLLVLFTHRDITLETIAKQLQQRHK